MVGPKWATIELSILDWARETIEKWAGMDVPTFIQHLWSDNLVEWGSITDPAVLLDEAAASGHEGAIRMLLDKWKKREDDEEKLKLDLQRAFHKGVMSGNESIVRLFLTCDVDIHALDDDGRSTLHNAAECGHEAVMRLLLEMGVDIDQADRNGDRPIDLAVKKNHEPIIRLLMRYGGAILTSSTVGASPRSVSKKADYTLDRVDNTGFNATIVHFYIRRPNTDGSAATESAAFDEHRVQIEQVENLVWNEDGLFEDVLDDKIGKDEYPKADFRWIHLPANNVILPLYC